MKQLFVFLLLILSFLYAFFIRLPSQNNITTCEYTTKSFVIKGVTPPALSLYGKGCCVMDPDNNRVLYGKNEDDKMPNASTTKIITALLALDSNHLQDMVTISSYAQSMPKVHLGMKKGQQFRLGDLLYSLMLMSHNDTAVAIAEHLGGTVSGFAKMMNSKAKELGMHNTHFVTPNGLDDSKHYTTPRDMCILASYAIKNKDFLSLVSTRSYTITEQTTQQTFSLHTTDSFLSLYEGALGIKTGFTGKAGYCFVGAARKNNKVYVCTTLAAGWPPDKSRKWADTKTLLDYAFDNYQCQTLPSKKVSSYKIRVKEGKSSSIAIADYDSPQLPLSKYDTIHITMKMRNQLTAPVSSAVSLGSIEYGINKDYTLSLPLYPKDSVDKKGFWNYFYEIMNDFV